MKRVISYAQNREDVLLNAFFANYQRGFYVDIGANHPTHDSVTKFFYDRGWKGMNVEPSLRLYRLLEDDRPRDINVHAGISDKPGTLTIREYEGWYSGLSTFSKEMQEENSDVKKYKDIEVEVITLRQLFATHKITDIDFMKVDVEGLEYEVLTGNDWEKYRPKVICIESNHMLKDWHPLLKNARYEKAFYDGLNEYFVAEEAKQLKTEFDYVKNIIGQPILAVQWDALLSNVENQAERYRSELEFYKSENMRLTGELIESKRVVGALKNFVKGLDGAIRRRIAKLNVHKQKELNEFVVQQTEDADTLLKNVHLYDLHTYYSLKPQHDRLAYRVANTTYSWFSQATFNLGKALLHAIRRVKR